ncbi:MAG: enoyl-CoA hydratase/isomerase family protein [Aquabacterium sp.]|nr:enoyl-CoA hydratase/isomerase family protein [Ferruginibacter sp.]
MLPVLFVIKNSVAVITLNRPEKYNAINRQMALLLQNMLDECAADKKVRAIYLTGSGKAFCAGQDLSELTGDDPPGFEVILAQHYNPIINKIRAIDKPVVCAVNGVAAGAGANIALCCDVVLAATSATFIQAFSKIGLIPDSGGTFILPRLIGFQKASALMMLGDKVTATEAERIGMIYKVIGDEDFEAASFKIAETLAGLPTLGLALTKQALNASLTNTLQQQLQREDELQFKAANTADYKEGINAFIEKRPPVFKGE